MKDFSRPKMDCNWIVVEANKMRGQVRAIMLKDVTDLEQRVMVKVAVRAMDYNALNAFLKTQ